MLQLDTNDAYEAKNESTTESKKKYVSWMIDEEYNKKQKMSEQQDLQDAENLLKSLDVNEKLSMWGPESFDKNIYKVLNQHLLENDWEFIYQLFWSKYSFSIEKNWWEETIVIKDSKDWNAVHIRNSSWWYLVEFQSTSWDIVPVMKKKWNEFDVYHASMLKSLEPELVNALQVLGVDESSNKSVDELTDYEKIWLKEAETFHTETYKFLNDHLIKNKWEFVYQLFWSKFIFSTVREGLENTIVIKDSKDWNEVHITDAHWWGYKVEFKSTSWEIYTIMRKKGDEVDVYQQDMLTSLNWELKSALKALVE